MPTADEMLAAHIPVRIHIGVHSLPYAPDR